MVDREIPSILRQPLKSTKLTPKDLVEGLRFPDEKGAEGFLKDIESLGRESGFTILNDLPTAEDDFNFDALVRTLSNVVLSERTQTPVTIGLHGKWGTGKTSILQMIEHKARMLNFPTVWLNAWSLENTDNFKGDVYDGILKYVEQGAKNRDRLARWSKGLFGGSASRQLERVQQEARRRQEDISEVASPEAASVVTTSPLFKELVDLALEKSRYGYSRLIIFVDDLDRAFPDQITTIIRNLKLVLEIPRCVFIIAMDMDLVAWSLEISYRSRYQGSRETSQGRSPAETTESGPPPDDFLGGGFGHQFLEKLIQIRVNVPSITRGSAHSYLRRNLITPEIIDIVSRAPDEVVTNPRRLKQHVNWISISLELLKSVSAHQDIDVGLGLRAMALRRHYPDLYDDWLEGRIDSKRPQPHLESYLANTNRFREVDGSLVSSFAQFLQQMPRERLQGFDEVMRVTPMLDPAPAEYQNRQEKSSSVTPPLSNLDRLLSGLKSIGFQPSTRSDKLYYSPASPTFRFRIATLVVRLERRLTQRPGQQWNLVRSFRINSEVDMALALEAPGRVASATRIVSKR